MALPRQYLLNDSQRTRLSRFSMIGLLPPPPLSRQKVVFLSQSSYESPIEPTGEREGGGTAKEPNNMKARKSGPL